MKKFNPNELTQNQEREINFCEKYSHRCLVPFYGFIKKENLTIGLLYKYMNNGSLNSLITEHSDKTTEFFSMLTMRRILNGMKFFHSNSFINRDLKPCNILVDNNNIPFISDFDAIRELKNQKDESNEEICMTNDIGSDLYVSPEQYNGEYMSYPTDIYSFGLIIYFLFEHKDQKNVFLKGKTERIPEITTNTPLINFLYNSIVKYDQKERMTIKEIENAILKNIESFEDIKYFINNFKTNDDLYHIPYYLYENISFLKENNVDEEFIEKYFYKCYCLLLIHLSKLDSKNSDILNNLGNLYYNGYGLEQDYFKARDYFELSANLKNSYGLYNLGYLYYYGKGVEQSYTKAKEFYEKSSKLNNPYAFNSIGTLYKRGLGVDQEYKKAEYYYNIAFELNVSDAMYNLGYLYYNGYGVEQDYKKSKFYYKKGIILNNTFCMNAMGFMHENGKGAKINYEKSRKYYEKAACLKNVNSIVNLALLYLNGIDNKHDYEKAKKLFEIAASKNSKNAIYNLGKIYKKGLGVQKDYKKAKKYFKKASELAQNDASYQLGNLYFKGK